MKATTIGAILLALAACKGKKDEAAPAAEPSQRKEPAPPPAIDAAPAPEADAPPVAKGPVACPPDAEAVKAAAQKIFALAGEIGEAQCTALFVGGAGHWLIELAYADAAHVDHFYAGLVDASTGQATWNDTYEAPEGVSLDTQQVVDLDGDGSDELLTDTTGGSHGMAWHTLTVRTIKDGKLADLGELKLGYTNEGAVAIGLDKKTNTCTATVEVIEGPAAANPVKQLAVVGAKPTGKPDPADCAAVGRRVFGLKDGALVQVE